jgi:spore maturation protein CgeB
MRVLFVGDLAPGRTGRQRCAAVRRVGHDVTEVDTSRLTAPAPDTLWQLGEKLALRVGYHIDVRGLSRQILTLTAATDPDVLWLDKVLCLQPSFFRRFSASRPTRRVVLYHPDDFKGRFNWSRQYYAPRCPLDLIVTSKSYNVDEYKQLGFRAVLFVNKSFDPIEHAPPAGHDRSAIRTSFDHDVGFVGGFEADRAGIVRELGRRGVSVHVQGSFWDRATGLPPNVTVAHGDLGPGDYASRLFRTKINLAFLRKSNRDLQTCRSFEIPACGGFMLSEATGELQRLFREGVHAEFFRDVDELHEKCRHYLDDDSARERIAQSGCQHVWTGGFRSDDVVRAVLNEVCAKHQARESFVVTEVR